MTGGFSFCGTDIATIGLEYAPELEDTYVYKPAKARIHEETFDGHNGGYYYGSSLEPKEFVLRCYFEEKEIDRGLMARVENLFREGRSGRLVFQRRPWCYYYATVTEYDPSEISNYMNGVIKVKMKAYYPYARSDIMAALRTSKDFYRMMANTAFFPDEKMIPPITFCESREMTDATELLLANPGTVRAHVGIEIAGDVGEGVTITNETTGQQCRFVAMNSANFDGVNSFVYLDGISGKCTTVNNGTSKVNFLYHDLGFIELEPAFPARRDLQVTVHNGTVYSTNKLYDRNAGETAEECEKELKGQYLWLGGKWREITGIGQEHAHGDWTASKQSEHIIQLKDMVSRNFSENTMISKMNKITVVPDSTMNLTRLKFIYKPTFS